MEIRGSHSADREGTADRFCATQIPMMAMQMKVQMADIMGAQKKREKERWMV